MHTTISCLLADDDIDDREIFQMVMQSLEDPVECRTVTNGIDALELLFTGAIRPDYVFLDVNMPRMNGIECLTRIREDKSFDDVRIYMYSTTAAQHVVEQSKALNAGYIEKPVSTKRLHEILTAVFRSPAETITVNS